jgi:hypothetical protein
MYGLAAEFPDAESLLKAAQQTREAGYNKVKAYTPYYVEGLEEVLDDNHFDIVPYLVVAMLFIGAGIGFFLQYWTSTEVYQFNIGGRPINSWPSFMIITFEFGILFAALTAVGALFIRSGLPQPYHPVFNASNIEQASRSRFFLCIETRDKNFRLDKTTEFLQKLGPEAVSEVPC